MLSSEIIIRRLAIIKYLYNVGVEQTKQVDSVAGFALLNFHDCAEMFLLLVGENIGIKNFDKLGFMEYWDKVPSLTLKESMKGLKERRVAIKHRCQFPSRNDIDISRIVITDFLIENTKSQFGLDFEKISLADLIGNDEVRRLTVSAENKLSSGDLYGSLCDSRLAFHTLLSVYDSNKSPFPQWDSILNIGEKIGDEYKKLIGSDRNSGYEWFKDVSNTVNQLREILKLTALGIDYRKYAYFDAVTPYVHFYCKPNEYGVLPRFEDKDSYEYRKNFSEANCTFCINFIIDCALKLQDFDFDRSQIYKTKEQSEEWFNLQKKLHESK